VFIPRRKSFERSLGGILKSVLAGASNITKWGFPGTPTPKIDATNFLFSEDHDSLEISPWVRKTACSSAVRPHARPRAPGLTRPGRAVPRSWSPLFLEVTSPRSGESASVFLRFGNRRGYEAREVGGFELAF
jgi:hypothetical protein